MTFRTLTKSEREFVHTCLKKNLRLDGREFNEPRNLRILFGADWGCVYVCLGETTVIAQTTCAIVQPKTTKPLEGLLHINVELGPLIRKQLTISAYLELITKVSRFLDRTIKDSRCIDFESLCIIADEKVWEVKCNVTVINNEGNILDCASVATICALASFRLPEIQVEDNETKTLKDSNNDLISLVLHHYPICVSYSVFDKGEIAVADPTIAEERCHEGSIMYSVNAFRELCSVSYSGTFYVKSPLLLRCANRAADRAKIIVDQIKECVENYTSQKSRGENCSLSECLRTQKLRYPIDDVIQLRLSKFKFENAYVPEYAIKVEDTSNVEKSDEAAILKSDLHQSWFESNKDMEVDDDDADYNDVPDDLF